LADAPIKNAGYAPAGGMGATAAAYIGRLWATYFPTLVVSGDRNSNASRTNIGAFQAAIWKLEYDVGSNDWDTGLLRRGNLIDGDTVLSDPHGELTLAAEMIATVTAAGYQGSTTECVALADPDQQDFVGANVPEPLSLVVWSLLGAGAGGMALRRRRTHWSSKNRQAIQRMIESKLQN
jgi:hypothetical protein